MRALLEPAAGSLGCCCGSARAAAEPRDVFCFFAGCTSSTSSQASTAGATKAAPLAGSTSTTEEAATKVSNKEKLKQYDAMVKSRDTAIAAAAAERESKAADIKKAVEAQKKLASKYSTAATEMAKMLVHLGMSEADVAQLMHLKTDSKKLMLTYKERNGETSAEGEAAAPEETAAPAEAAAPAAADDEEEEVYGE